MTGQFSQQTAGTVRGHEVGGLGWERRREHLLFGRNSVLFKVGSLAFLTVNVVLQNFLNLGKS